ncbi:MAG: phosphatidate cytidylyltransferase [Lautropia sp.]|nr:phosphatidate cytidylyltransferase [Lautropia sp.]
MLRQRVVTALVLVLLVVGVLFWGSQTAWALLTLPVLGLALWEWCRLLSRSWIVPLLISLTAAGAYHLYRADLSAPPGWVVPLLLVGLLAWLLVAVPSVFKARPSAGSSVWLACLCLFNLWLALYEFRVAGPWVLLSVMAIVWLADTGAYFAGRSLGRHKLAPKVSPGKTWEGVAGGIVLVCVVAWLLTQHGTLPADAIFSSAIARHVGMAGMMWLLALIVMVSVLGDLYESLLKRAAGVKDSSQVLPGHGGVFDRIDALVPAMPLCLLIWILMLP